MKKLKIECQGADTVPLDFLIPFQGDLKKISPENLEKLRTRIVEDGFSVPFFVWDKDGTYYLLDGHQRLAVLKSLAGEYEIPPLPVAYIKAKNKKEAKKKLLSIISQYGELQEDELKSWLDDLDEGIAETLRFIEGEIDLGLGLDEIEEIIEDDEEIETEPEKVTITVYPKTKKETEQIYNDLKEKGYKCKLTKRN